MKDLMALDVERFANRQPLVDRLARDLAAAVGEPMGRFIKACDGHGIPRHVSQKHAAKILVQVTRQYGDVLEMGADEWAAQGARFASGNRDREGYRPPR